MAWPLCDLILPDGTNYKISESPEKKSWLGKEKSFAVFRAGSSPDLIHFLEVAAELLERIKTSGGDRVMTASKAPGLSLEVQQVPEPDFTPGPWRLGLDANDSDSFDIWAGDELIGTAYRLMHSSGNRGANAQLFAGALEMYKALEAAVSFERNLDKHLAELIEQPLTPIPWIAQAEAALAKARGE